MVEVRGTVTTAFAIALCASCGATRAPTDSSVSARTSSSSRAAQTSSTASPSEEPSSSANSREWVYGAGARTLDCAPYGSSAPVPTGLPELVIVVVTPDCVIRILDTAGALVWTGPGQVSEPLNDSSSLHEATVSFQSGIVHITVGSRAVAGPPGCFATTPIGEYLDLVACWPGSENLAAGVRQLGPDHRWGPLLGTELFERTDGTQTYSIGHVQGTRFSPDGRFILIEAGLECESPAIGVLERDSGEPSTAFGGLHGQAFETIGWTEASEILMVRPKESPCAGWGKAGLWAIAADGTQRRVWWEPAFDSSYSRSTFIRLSRTIELPPRRE